MKKLPQWLLLTAATLIALGLATHSLLSWTTGRGRTAAVERLQERLIAMAPAPPPTNPAASPAATLSPGYQPPTPELITQWQDLFDAWDKKLQDKAFADRWDRLHLYPLRIRWGKLDYNDLSEEDQTFLSEFLTENEDILQAILTLTQPDMPPCDFGSYKQKNRLWHFEVLLSANILLNTSNEEYEQAMKDLIALFKMSDADPYIDYPFTMVHGTEKCLRDALGSGSVPDEVWRALLDQLNTSRDHRTFVDNWARNASHELAWYEDLPDSIHRGITERPLEHAGMWAYRYAATPLMNHNMETFSAVMDQLLEIAPLPYYEARPRLEQIRDDYDIPPPWELRPWQYEPGYWNISTLIHERFGGQAYTEAHIDITRMAILLERHRVQHGTYPDSLEAIADGLGGRLPRNPINGEPFHYEREQGTFRLWYHNDVTNENGEEERSAAVWPGAWEPVETTNANGDNS